MIRSRGSMHIVQNCWVVSDINVAMQDWLKLGYGPFHVMELEISDALYRGRLSPLKSVIAVTSGGGIQIELIQQLSEGQSAYRDMYGKNEGGFHHICIISDNYEAERAHLKSMDITIATEAEFLGMNFCYVDTRETLGCMLEVVSDGPIIRYLYKTVEEASLNWDGHDPIRVMAKP